MKYYVIDSFADHVFEGNPAGVCIMDKWIPAQLMENIAIENNLSETAFAVKEGDKYRIRWFTPGGEIDLCGHATLATAFTILNFYEKDAGEVTFITAEHGELYIKKKGDLLEMEFPFFDKKEVEVTDLMEEVIGVRPLRAFLGRDLVCILENEELVRNNNADQAKMMELEGALLHITAKGKDFDCVSRSYGPKLKIPEDPVCGSGHCHIVPVWGKLENKTDYTAYQASRRGGTLYCKIMGENMKLSGKAVLYAEGELHVEA
ncbi:MAG: PhzF family phenazine biosynthesis protein [Clostridia bacterium]|nr:PhzF family phenazine biosynthesis protein [Clostridia bacterium]